MERNVQFLLKSTQPTSYKRASCIELCQRKEPPEFPAAQNDRSGVQYSGENLPFLWLLLLLLFFLLCSLFPLKSCSSLL